MDGNFFFTIYKTLNSNGKVLSESSFIACSILLYLLISALFSRKEIFFVVKKIFLYMKIIP